MPPMPPADTPPPAPGNTPESPPVHFSQGGLGTGGGTPPVFATLIPVLFPMLCFAVPIFLLTVLDRYPWLPAPLRFAIVSLLVLAALWWGGRAAVRAYRRGTDIAGLPMAMDEAARVNVICWNDQRRDLAAITDEAFEPEQFRVFLTGRMSPAIRRLRRRHQQALGAASSMFWLAIYFPAVAGFGVVSVFILVACLLVAVWMYRRPTYLRIVPGRIDILRYPLLSRPSTAPDIESIDIRGEPVRINLKANAVRVGPWTKAELPKVVGTNPVGNDPASFTLPLWSVPQRRAAIRAILRACISTAAAAPIEQEIEPSSEHA